MHCQVQGVTALKQGLVYCMLCIFECSRFKKLRESLHYSQMYNLCYWAEHYTLNFSPTRRLNLSVRIAWHDARRKHALNLDPI